MLSPGTIVGEKYRLEEPIGQGGMATVWRAVHTTLDRPVAVKFLDAVGTGSQQLAERFLEEAKLAAGLRHRHVVDILDFGVTPERTPFMVMELLEGQSLADRYNDGPPVTDWEVLEIVAMTLSGLAAVHDAGILHRDVKPENMFLVHDADGVFPKLLDFGISRGFGAIGRVTRTGVVVGTPQYMSPEQARGKKDLDGRSDLFSMGIVLYEGLAGEVPFDSENPGDVLIAVATEEPRPIEELRPDLPRSVIELVHRALRKSPDERFQSAREMRDAVMQVLQGGEPMTGRPPSTVIRTSYTSTQGTGKLRALSVRPGANTAAAPTVPELPKPAPVGVLPPGAPSPIAPALLPPPRGAPPRRRSSSGLFYGLGVVVLVAMGVYAGHMTGVLPLPDLSGAGASGRAGALEPGAVVPLAAQAAQSVALDPPPTDGVPAPPIETVDVPSPPDPPDRVPAEGLGATLDGALDGGASASDGGVDAGTAAAAEIEQPRPRRRRGRRRRAR